MLFNSLEYIIFFPLVFAMYWGLSNRANARNAVLVIASYIFYGWWDYRFLALLAFTTLSTYACGVAMDMPNTTNKMRKWLCVANIGLNIVILAYFKYFNFFGESFAWAMNTIGWNIDWVTRDILLPVGISFYTFQAIAYTIDVYRRSTVASHNPITFAAFLSFFPQLVAGPIERASHLLPQFSSHKSFSTNFYDGARQILWGFFKKMVIADNCALFVDSVWNQDYLSGSTMLLAAFMFTFQIYGDFSGYSDIAIGTGKLFGINLSTNFRTPYFSKNIGEFWRRWHISLTAWFKDYVYIPLGGSRTSSLITARNIVIVFALSGLWHGANWTFITWGIYHAILLIAYSLLISRLKYVFSSPLFSVIGGLFTFIVVMLGWIIFRSESIAQACDIISRIFSPSVFDYVRTNKEHYLVYIAFMLIVEWVYRNKEHAICIAGNGMMKYKAVRWIIYFGIMATIIVLSGPNGKFIYFQF